jgi:hypothetical protein
VATLRVLVLGPDNEVLNEWEVEQHDHDEHSSVTAARLAVQDLSLMLREV